MSDFKVNSIATKQGQHGPVIAGVSTVNSTGCMKIPSGPTEFRGGRGRGVWGGGSIYPGSSYQMYDTIDFITIASEGNATDFGNLLASKHFTTATGSNSIRGLFAGGSRPAIVTEIQSITIASTGDASDFGDLSASKYNGAGASDSHGGIAS